VNVEPAVMDEVNTDNTQVGDNCAYLVHNMFAGSWFLNLEIIMMDDLSTGDT
jgi:hypothetical protein